MADSTSTLKVLITAQNQTTAAFNQMNNSINGLKTAALALGTALAGALSFRNIIDATRQWGQEVDRLQDELGGTAEQMSALNFIAQSVGLSTDELSQTFGILNKRIADSVPEIMKGTSVFDQWGIKLKDASGNIVSFDEAMRHIKQRFQEVGQGAQGTALLLDIFGRSGKTLSDFLALTDDEMKKMIGDAQDFGLILGGNASAAIQQFNRSLNRVQLQFEGLKVQLGLFLLPLLSALISAVSRGMGYIKQLGEAIGRMLGPLKQWIDKLGGVKAIADALLKVGVALLGLAVLGGMIALVGWLAGLVGYALPLVAIATGLGLVALAIADFADAWDSNAAPFDKFIRFLGDAEAGLAGLSLVFLAFGHPVVALFLATIGLVIEAAKQTAETIQLVMNNWDKTITALNSGQLGEMPILNWIPGLKFVIDTIADVKSAWDKILLFIQAPSPSTGIPVLLLIKEKVLDLLGPIGDAIRLFETLLRLSGQSITAPVVTGGTNPDRGGGGGGTMVWKSFLGRYVTQQENSAAVSCEAGGGQWNWEDHTCFHPYGGGGGARLFGSGGIVTKPTLAMIGEAGPEAVVPLSRGGGFGNISIVINGDVDSASRVRDLANQVSAEIMRAMGASGNWRTSRGGII